MLEILLKKKRVKICFNIMSEIRNSESVVTITIFLHLNENSFICISIYLYVHFLHLHLHQRTHRAVWYEFWTPLSDLHYIQSMVPRAESQGLLRRPPTDSRIHRVPSLYFRKLSIQNWMQKNTSFLSRKPEFNLQFFFSFFCLFNVRCKINSLTSSSMVTALSNRSLIKSVIRRARPSYKASTIKCGPTGSAQAVNWIQSTSYNGSNKRSCSN